VKQFIIAVILLTAAATATAQQLNSGPNPTSHPENSPFNHRDSLPSNGPTPPNIGTRTDEFFIEAHPSKTISGGGAPGIDHTHGSLLAPSGEVPLVPEREIRLDPVSRKHDVEESHNKADEARTAGARFGWRSAVEQSLLFLSVQHGYALTQPKTRRSLSGNFFEDYAASVRSLRGWDDGGKFFTNYVAHPMQGSLLGFVQVQNDPIGSRLRFGRSGQYWRSRAKALAWSAAWSTQFEIGPISQASIGNVGLYGKQTYVDLVITPTAGLGLLVAEDILDKYVIERLERRFGNSYVRILSRVALNPTRTAANLLRLKKPWHRDEGLR
jgi:hypothetical protein